MMKHAASYHHCTICGRNCGIDRTTRPGWCGGSDALRLAWAGLHFGEEPPLVGTGGSGTVFFSGCTLGCPFCQNFQISRQGMGQNVDGQAFLEIVQRLRNRGAENLNLVTPSHFIPSLLELLPGIKKEDFPVIWNSSGQEKAQAMKEIFPFVDVFLPDLKTLNPQVAKKYYSYEKYPAIVEPTLLEMVRRRPLLLDDRGVLKKGVLVRHLVLPGELDSTREVLEWFARHMKGRAMLSVMSQYTPVVTAEYPEPQPGRFLLEEEYDRVVQMLFDFDLEDGFIQDWVTGSDWLPDFNRINPFSSDLSRPLWHWKDGFVQD